MGVVSNTNKDGLTGSYLGMQDVFGYYRFLYNDVIESLVQMELLSNDHRLLIGADFIRTYLRNKYVMDKGSYYKLERHIRDYIGSGETDWIRLLKQYENEWTGDEGHNWRIPDYKMPAFSLLHNEFLALILHNRQKRSQTVEGKWELGMPCYICECVAHAFAEMFSMKNISGQIHFDTRLAKQTSMLFRADQIKNVVIYDHPTSVDRPEVRTQEIVCNGRFHANLTETYKFVFKIDRLNPLENRFYHMYFENNKKHLSTFWINDSKRGTPSITLIEV